MVYSLVMKSSPCCATVGFFASRRSVQRQLFLRLATIKIAFCRSLVYQRFASISVIFPVPLRAFIRSTARDLHELVDTARARDRRRCTRLRCSADRIRKGGHPCQKWSEMTGLSCLFRDVNYPFRTGDGTALEFNYLICSPPSSPARTPFRASEVLLSPGTRIRGRVTATGVARTPVGLRTGS